VISLGVRSEQEGTPSARGCTHETQKVGVPKTRPALFTVSKKTRVSGADAPINEKTHFTLRRRHCMRVRKVTTWVLTIIIEL
jgi:hypothetical protein